MKRTKKKDPGSAANKLIRVPFVMLLIEIYEPFRKRRVLLKDKTVAAEGILSLLSLLSRLSGYPPTEFCENLHEPPCRSVSRKTVEI